MMPVSITENAREILKVINKYPLMMAKERERERERERVAQKVSLCSVAFSAKFTPGGCN